jgi:hypothetical protein
VEPPDAGIPGRRRWLWLAGLSVVAVAAVASAMWIHQSGHIAAQVAKRYSHIRRQELNRAAATLEPQFLRNVLVITPDDTDTVTVN